MAARRMNSSSSGRVPVFTLGLTNSYPQRRARQGGLAAALLSGSLSSGEDDVGVDFEVGGSVRGQAGDGLVRSRMDIYCEEGSGTFRRLQLGARRPATR